MRVTARVLLWLLLATARAAAQGSPSLVIEAPSELTAARARLAQFDGRPLGEITRLVGLDQVGPPIRVVLADSLSEWARLVPPWAAGFAAGEDSLVVLFPARSPSYPHDTLEDVLRHEVAHVLITRAAGGAQVPRWFHEGLAVAVERPWTVEDRTRLISALVFGPRLTLAAVDSLFLGDEGTQQRAYTLSAAIVRHLMAAHGAGAPAGVLRELARGRPFDYALASVTAQSLPTFEAAFWDAQRTWTTWVPLAVSSTVLWLGVIGLAAIAGRRRRRRSAALRQQWADEEAAAPSLESGPPDDEDKPERKGRSR